ncbi:MAG: aspartate-semialdehyde dehydrogenase [bacterium]|nr:aspartate-semialdehyde dehydrogenase [bacterium]
MLSLGVVGWRGMVGSVLMERMLAEDDFAGFETKFYSTSAAGAAAPVLAGGDPLLGDATDLSALARHDVIITCQGGGYTEKFYPELRRQGWKGYWIDAASTLRLADDAVIVLDPVNGDLIRSALTDGVKTFVGGNCTVSLMLMALAPLFRAGEVEWISSMTYQAASGAGARQMTELLQQMGAIYNSLSGRADSGNESALTLEKTVTELLRDGRLPHENLLVPLAGSLIPWIDTLRENGQTREEWKGMVETNRILGNAVPVPVDGVCVRVGVLRCHSQAFQIKLKRDIPLADIEAMLASQHEWAEVVPNTKEATIARLTPTAVTGSLRVPVGRLRKTQLGPEYLTAFSVGDQLLWGAAEPLRRMLLIVREYLGK